MNRAQILELWATLPDSQSWGHVDYVQRTVERSDWVLVFGSGDELFAIVDTQQKRVLDEDEAPSSLLNDLTLEDVG